MRWICGWMVLTCSVLAVLAEAPAETARQALVVASLAASEEYQVKCEAWAADLAAALVTRWGFQPADVTLASSASKLEVPAGVARIAATRTDIESALKSCAATRAPEADLMIFVFGSGSFDGREYKLNLKGPDLSGSELKSLLDAIVRRRQVLFVGTSGSGELLKLLASRNRLIVTATRSGFERNDPRFPGFFLDCLRAADSDTDKDARISWLEAFQAAKSKTEESYKAEGHMATEHAVFDDDGDGEWHPLSAENKGDGLVASGITLDWSRPAAATAGQDAALQTLYKERDQLEAAVREWRGKKAEVPAEEYDRKLEELLLRLARISSEIRQRETPEKKPQP